MLSDSELIELNSEGFIPGPLENEEAFIARVAEVRALFEKGEWIPRSHWDWVRIHLQEVFDFAPRCLPAFYSNRNLMPWQGAASWIEEGKLVSVQLREGLRKGSHWGYLRSEILAHEAVHAARSAFEEPASEEFFAYMVSEKWWRRAFGPIVRTPWEVWPFFIAIALGIFSPWGSFAGALWTGVGFWRLMKLHRRIRLAGNYLMETFQDAKKARAVLVRLTDREIQSFAKGQDLFAYAGRQKCLRWRLIRLVYLGKMELEVIHG